MAQLLTGTIGARRDADPVSEAVLPLQQHLKASFQEADPIIDLVHSRIKLSSDSEEYLRICFNEVIQNVQDHSESPVGCVVSARFMTQSREIRVAIVDRGCGICSTLSRRYADTTPELALKRVTQGNYSALSRPNNMGLGVSNLCGIVMRLAGSIFILSESAAIDYRSGKGWSLRSLPYRFAGTGVFFTLPIADD